jgi:Ca2+-binding RTX toxin-like protein
MMRRTILMVATMALTLLVASGVALAVNKIGTNGPDALRGTNGDDNLVGLGGNDELLAFRGDDSLLGGPGKDVLSARTNTGDSYGGHKTMLGGPGNDFVYGGKVSDNIVGSGGNDFLFEGAEPGVAWPDNIAAGDGNDAIWVLNWSPRGKDVLTCGSGVDRVLADRTDVIAANCEKVFYGRRNIDAFFESIPDSFWEGLNPEFI